MEEVEEIESKSKDDLPQSDEKTRYKLWGNFRNHIEHFNAVTNAYKYVDSFKGNSYYALFNYVTQKILFDQMNKSLRERLVKELEYINNAKEYIDRKGNYSKDLLKILCMPLAYNLPRYKNLTIEELFYSKENNEKMKEKSKEQK